MQEEHFCTSSLFLVFAQAVHTLVHPNFNHTTFESDLALVKMGNSVPYTWFARPACLPLPGENTYITVTNLDRCECM